MKRKKTVIRYFKCPECSVIITAPKSKSKGSEKGHIKTMYCYKCKQKRDFVLIDKEEY